MSLFELKIFVFLLFLHFSSTLDCGNVKVGTSFVAGGDESFKGQWPWLVSLFSKDFNKLFCGSSIISKRHLLGGQ